MSSNVRSYSFIYCLRKTYFVQNGLSIFNALSWLVDWKVSTPFALKTCVCLIQNDQKSTLFASGAIHMSPNLADFGLFVWRDTNFLKFKHTGKTLRRNNHCASECSAKTFLVRWCHFITKFRETSLLVRNFSNWIYTIYILQASVEHG